MADEELAKREAERARKRERELDDDAALRDSPPPRRHRSPSYDSVSSISTRSPSPAPRQSRSPERRERRRESRSPSLRGPHGRKPSYDSGGRYSRGPSESPARGYQARGSRPPPSPSPHHSPPARSERGGREARRYGSPGLDARGKDSYARRAYSSSRSRSPVRREVEETDMALAVIGIGMIGATVEEAHRSRRPRHPGSPPHRAREASAPSANG